MIRLTNRIPPQVLVEHSDEWTVEYIEWCENPIGPEPRRYAHLDIRYELELETSSKCAYCEGRVTDVAYAHIEHKLPKRKNPTLVCRWDNLTIACPRCNTNKGDYDDPECPLLDPYVDNVEEQVAFVGPLALARGGSRAQVTITLLDLNRKDLLFSRKEVLETLYRLLGLVERASREPAALRELWFDIDRHIAADGEFASACRQFLAFQMAERGIVRV